jgi:glycosyltransferase involved in cell wall biosynthesis
MRVLLVTRRGIWRFAGGEQTQIVNTRRHLEALGLEVEQVEDLPHDYRRYDVIHFFALAHDHIAKIKAARGVVKVLSPIYWDRYQSFGDTWHGRRPPALARRVLKLRQSLAHRRARRNAARGDGHVPVGRLAPAPPVDPGGMEGFVAFQEVIDLVDFFLPNSEMEMASVRRNYVMGEPPRHAVVHNAIDAAQPDARSEWYAQRFGEMRAVVSSAAIEVRKNQCGLVCALWEVDVPIILAGQIRDQGYYLALEWLMRRRPRVYLTGHLESADLSSLYHHAAAHALPSYHETPGISNLEAIAHGCPNVSTKIGGLEEYVGPHSLYCNPYHGAHIRDQVLAALEMPRNTEGAAYVRERYTWENSAKETLAAYEQALSLGGPRH